MKLFLPIFLTHLLLLLLVSSGIAETRYISDNLIVTVRGGKGNEFKIIETIPTGTPVVIIEEGKAYIKVRTPKGSEGYVRRHYISKSIPKKTQIKQLHINITSLNKQIDTQRKESLNSHANIDTYTKQINEFEIKLKQLQDELKATTKKYDELLLQSENVLNISAENQQLIGENNVINGEILILRDENQKFHRTNMIQWFLAGGSVFFGGWLIGKISRKKRRAF